MKMMVLLFLPLSIVAFSMASWTASFLPSEDPILVGYLLWSLLCVVPFGLRSMRGGWLELDPDRVRRERQTVAWATFVVALAVAIFILRGWTAAYSDVRYPLVFIFLIPIVEEVIFRGWVFEISDRTWSHIHKLIPIILSAALFGLHHLQYYDFRLGKFALFQVVYTTLLGLVLGHLRWKTGSIYVGIILHVGMNAAAYLA